MAPANFLKGETDVLFALEASVRHISDIRIEPFYESKIRRSIEKRCTVSNSTVFAIDSAV